MFKASVVLLIIGALCRFDISGGPKLDTLEFSVTVVGWASIYAGYSLFLLSLFVFLTALLLRRMPTN